MPFFTMIAASFPDRISARAWVPLDDNWNMLITMSGFLSRPAMEEERARAAKDFATSDRLRAELAALGVVVTDGPDGQTWRLAAG
jgi:hypothetical protein